MYQISNKPQKDLRKLIKNQLTSITIEKYVLLSLTQTYRNAFRNISHRIIPQNILETNIASDVSFLTSPNFDPASSISAVNCHFCQTKQMDQNLTEGKKMWFSNKVGLFSLIMKFKRNDGAMR